MANFGDLLGSLLGGGMGGSAQEKVQNALGNSGLGDLLGKVAGGLGNSLGQAGGQMRDNPMAAGGLGALVGSLLGGGGKAVSGALGGGALGLIASIALQALSNRDQPGGNAGQPAANLQAALEPGDSQASEGKAQLLIQAMISAAKADGQIDRTEMDRILGKMKEAGADAEVQAWAMREVSAPLDLDALVAAIPDQASAAEVYAASLFAIELDTLAEQDYLNHLAAKTGLGADVVNHIHQALGVR